MSQMLSPSELWANFHYIFVSYLLPVVLIIGILQNSFTLAALIGVHKGIGRTTRALITALALADIFNLILWYGLSGFADFGLNYLTNGTFYLRALYESDFVCKPLRGLGYFGLHCSHWLYVLVNADRLLAVLMPHRSQRSRKRRCLMLLAGLLLISGILTGGFSAFMYRVNNSVAVGGALSINYKCSYIFRMIVTVLVLRP